MGHILKDDVLGYWVDGALYCMKCAWKARVENVKDNEILRRIELELGSLRYFCDVCLEEITLTCLTCGSILTKRSHKIKSETKK